MLPEHIKLEVVTPARQVVSEQVDAIQLPGKDGYLGIFPATPRLLTALGIGALSYVQSGQTHYLTMIDGFAEVSASGLSSSLK